MLLNIHNKALQLKVSEDMHHWASTQSGLSTPRYILFHKKGRGIFRRFFHWIPSKGVGAVNRALQPKFPANGTSRLHEFLDIGVIGTVSTRRAACKRCDSCWKIERSNCANINYVGSPKEIQIVQEHLPTAATERMARTHKEEQMHPWVIGKVLQAVHETSASLPFDSSKDAVQFEALKVNELALKLQLYEALDVGSFTYFISELTVCAPARCVRVVVVQLEEARSRSSARVQTMEKIGTRGNRGALLARLLCPSSLLLASTNSRLLEEIFMTQEVQDEANKCREVAVKGTSDPRKFTVVTLKALLASRRLDTSGQKASLVQRVRDVLRM
ncbi:MAG: hypothetical protein SGPRY_000548 [Prymnesium sp.]